MLARLFANRKTLLIAKAAAAVATIALEYINIKYSGRIAQYAGTIQNFVQKILAKI